MTKSVNHVLIVGGGTAGWITAGLLAARHGAANGGQVEITLVESPDIPNIGVGEGTWPSMRMTLQRMGISEVDFLKVTGASFKQGTRFIGWSGLQASPEYYHPFSLPLDYATRNLAEAWLQAPGETSFADYVTPQSAIIAAGRAPKQLATPEYAFNMNYGYHLDAGKFSVLLHQHVVGNLGVNYRSANVRDVDVDGNGDVTALVLEDGSKLEGDLFVDCTGQRARLVGEHYGAEFVSLGRQLINDRAVAAQVPYDAPETAINSATHATAQDNGWIWDIGLQSRRGVGYVFSSAHLADDAAADALARYIQSVSPECALKEVSMRAIGFTPGYRRTPWINNCVAVGLSAGFVEPLEASALALVEQAATLISQELPATREIMCAVARRFNDKMNYHWARIVEFLKLHYAISERDDTAYWRDVRDPSGWPDSLRDKLLVWQQQAPWHDDAPRVDELFPSASYQYVLYGMGFRPSSARSIYTAEARAKIDALAKSNSAKAARILAALPDNRTLLRQLCEQTT